MLLANPELLNKPVRILAEAAGISTGAASNTLKDLKEEGFIAAEGRRRFLLNPQKLARRWVELYPVVLKPKLHVRRYSGPRPQEMISRGKDWEEYAQLGGEAAMLAMGYGIRPIETQFMEVPYGACLSVICV